jgi:TatA/E family protein of Tat protein translocase
MDHLSTLAFGLGGTEIALILLLVIVIFALGRLPTLGRDVGTAVREFKEESAASGDNHAIPEGEVEGAVISKALGKLPIVRKAKVLAKKAESLQRIVDESGQ